MFVYVDIIKIRAIPPRPYVEFVKPLRFSDIDECAKSNVISLSRFRGLRGIDSLNGPQVLFDHHDNMSV